MQGSKYAMTIRRRGHPAAVDTTQQIRTRDSYIAPSVGSFSL